MSYPDNLKANFEQRDPADGVDELFYHRWSPRSLKKAEIAESDLKTILDAARWAPSCFNEQPWRFYTSTPASFDKFYDLLNEGNQAWAHNASVLGFIVETLTFKHNGKTNAYADFDCGAAWMSIALQARKLGLYTHAMAGIQKERVYDALGIDRENHRVVVGFLVGVLDEPDKLPENIRVREKPNPRIPLEELWTAVR